MKIITFIFLSVLLISCSNEGTTPLVSELIFTHGSQYIKGEIYVILKDSVSLEDFADYIYSLDSVTIRSVRNLHYSSVLPKDSMQVIDSVIKSKSSIGYVLVKTSFSDSAKTILTEFPVFSFNRKDLIDWKYLKERFKLSHIPYPSSTGTLKVPIGKEKELVNYLSQTDYFKEVSLAYSMEEQIDLSGQ